MEKTLSPASVCGRSADFATTKRILNKLPTLTKMKFDYYTPPSDAIFEDVKAKCIALWQTYDDTHGYATEKVNRIKDIENIGDNTCYMIAMFDHNNMRNLIAIAEGETREWMEELYQLMHVSYHNHLFYA